MRNTAGRQALDRLSVQMRTLVSSVETRGGQTMNSSEREKWNRLKAAYEKQEAAVCASEGTASLDETPGRVTISDFGALGGMPDDRALRAMRPHARREAMKSPEERAFSNYLRMGMNALDADEQQIMRGQYRDANALGIRNAQSSTGSQGGYLVPQGFAAKLMEAMKWFGGIDGIVGEFETETGNPWPYPTVDDVSNMGRVVGQNVQVTETDFVFGQVTFNSYILSSDIVLVPISLMEDSYFDLDALLARLLGIRLGRLLNLLGTVGTGTAEPTGIVTAALLSDLIYTMVDTAGVTYNDLVGIQHSVDPAYRSPNSPNCRWMFPDPMLKLLKLLVDNNGRPLWQPGLTASFGDGATVIGGGKPTILADPYVINQDMPVPVASANSILYGDMGTFQVRKVGSPTILRLVERYADYFQVGFVSFFRCDSDLIDAGTHPIVVGQQAA